jgi:hypothetical protein
MACDGTPENFTLWEGGTIHGHKKIHPLTTACDGTPKNFALREGGTVCGHKKNMDPIYKPLSYID